VRILQVVQELAPGGAERLVVALAAGAREAGHEMAVAAAPGPLAAELGLRVHSLPLVERRPWRLPLAARAVRRAVAAEAPDLVHAHNPGMAAAVSLATLRGRRPPALATMHGVPEEDYPAAARLLRLAGLPAVACGPGVAAGLAQRGYSVLTTVVNGVSPAPEALGREELERRYGLPRGGKVVVAAGRLVPQKNHVLAVRALAGVPGATLLVLGEGELRAEIERAAERAGVGARVVLVGVRPDARAVLAAADALVLPSVWEGLPLVALEALAAGVPIVATAVRGVRELLTDGRDALLAPPGDAGAFAAALRAVLEDGALARRLAAAGAELAARHSEEAMVAGYLDLYATLAADG
jgi:glycosyltransferase involved in cell wall biosynthesis